MALLNVPTTTQEWASWAWDHRASHDRIRQKIEQQQNVQLQDYQIEPMTQESLDLFLDNNTNLHDAMNTALGLVGNDLTDVDFNDENQVKEWIGIHYQEHYDAENKVGP